MNPPLYPDIDLRARVGDTRFECPVCHWSVTLKPEGVAVWTENGTITPRCRKDDVALTRTDVGYGMGKSR